MLISFEAAVVVYSNLGGVAGTQGLHQPDRFTPQEILYANVSMLDGVPVWLRIENQSAYDANNIDINGAWASSNAGKCRHAMCPFCRPLTFCVCVCTLDCCHRRHQRSTGGQFRCHQLEGCSSGVWERHDVCAAALHVPQWTHT